jgi:hypothetical protein
MELVFIHHQIPLNQLISDVKLGIGPIKSVLLVQTIGFSILKELVFQFLIIVEIMMLQGLAQFAMLDMT